MLREIAQVIAAQGEYRIGEWFTEDFRLIEPTKPNWPRGHEGARKLLEAFRTLRPPIEFVALDMVEEGHRVAVRWQLSATHQGELPIREGSHRRGLGHPHSRGVARLVGAWERMLRGREKMWIEAEIPSPSRRYRVGPLPLPRCGRGVDRAVG
jgi:hypothetical protein